MEPLQNSTTIEEFLFCSTTEDGKLNNLQELTTLGKNYFIDGQNTQLIFFEKMFTWWGGK